VLAAAGDEIWVAQGHYSGDVTRLAPGMRMIGGFLGTEEVAEGRGLDPAGTILMATNTNPVIRIEGGGSTAGTVISGFTLNPQPGSTPSGRGVLATNAVVTLKHCRFEGFRGSLSVLPPDSGLILRPALWATQGALTVESCVSSKNSSLYEIELGSALAASLVNPVIIRSNAFVANSKGDSTCIHLSECVGEVTDNRFEGNLAGPESYSGAVGIYRSGIAILRNRFLFNRGGPCGTFPTHRTLVVRWHLRYAVGNQLAPAQPQHSRGIHRN
jgi:hypothetical protein